MTNDCEATAANLPADDEHLENVEAAFDHVDPYPTDSEERLGKLAGMSDEAIENLTPEGRALLGVPHDAIGSPTWTEKAAAETAARGRAEADKTLKTKAKNAAEFTRRHPRLFAFLGSAAASAGTLLHLNKSRSKGQQ